MGTKVSKSEQKKEKSHPAASASSAGLAVGAKAKPKESFPIISTNFSKDYSLKTEIGSGYTSKCYMCQDKKHKTFHACKVSFLSCAMCCVYEFYISYSNSSGPGHR